ncbi:hypothetical protein O6H91_18G039000 [Diphasiastrum complanatum]|nr:hypothetical protein O6H91_18G039000 [Diphasiastrum complanatum]
MESSLRDRAYKMAAIANLAKGLGFFHILFNNDRNAGIYWRCSLQPTTWYLIYLQKLVTWHEKLGRQEGLVHALRHTNT